MRESWISWAIYFISSASASSCCASFDGARAKVLTIFICLTLRWNRRRALNLLISPLKCGRGVSSSCSPSRNQGWRKAEAAEIRWNGSTTSILLIRSLARVSNVGTWGSREPPNDVIHDDWRRTITRYIIPIRRRVVELAAFNRTEQGRVVFIIKRRKTTQPKVGVGQVGASPKYEWWQTYNIYIITPMLHKSTDASYPNPEMISGATYPGVPQAVLIVTLSSCLSFARPKSAILIVAPSSVLSYSRFSGFKSLWV